MAEDCVVSSTALVGLRFVAVPKDTIDEVLGTAYLPYESIGKLQTF
jgi:hypothetical protein